jgi:guanylate kinase
MKPLIVIAAPSGAGKTTLCKRLLNEFGDQLVLSVSSTTRPARANEIHGRDYFFISKKEFEKDIAAGFFAEWAEVHGHYYGTSKRVIRDAHAAGKSVLLDIDVQGAASLREQYGSECLTVFVAPPSMEELETRLRARAQDSPEVIAKRMKNAAREMARADEFDVQIINDNLNRAYERLREVVQESEDETP